LIIAALALALSACGSSASSGTSASSAPASTASPASSGSPALSGSTTSSDASATEFCETWQEFRTTLKEMSIILSYGPKANPSTTSASVLLPTMQAIGSAFGQLGKVAPPAVSADMAALTTYWSQVVADFQYGKTVTQVEAYIKAHPPTNAATINGNMAQLNNYLTSTCHINLSS
jgi:hypothetical protein